MNPSLQAEPASHLRVLIVDDSRHFRTAAKTLFQMMPRVAFVATADSGEAALALADGGAFDLVVLDLSMAGLNGLEVAKRLCAFPRAPKIVMVTLHDHPDFRFAASDAGVTEFMPKPALAGQIEPMLERMLGAPA